MQMNERNGAREQSSAEQANESAVRANGFQVAQYIRLDSWLFWTMHCGLEQTSIET